MKSAIIIIILFSILVLSSCSSKSKDKGRKGKKENGKYVVHPGVDVSMATASTWTNTYTSPANLYFGPRPYIVGWVGAGPRPGPAPGRPRPPGASTVRPIISTTTVRPMNLPPRSK